MVVTAGDGSIRVRPHTQQTQFYASRKTGVRKKRNFLRPEFWEDRYDEGLLSPTTNSGRSEEQSLVSTYDRKRRMGSSPGTAVPWQAEVISVREENRMMT